MIEGGYYLKPRCIAESKIAHAPPHVREIWDWLIRNAVFDKEKKHGSNLERGQLFCTVNRIREDLCWYAGYRKEMYKKASCENAMKWLVAAGMITTTKTTRGTVVSICNYSIYQNPENYGCRTESRNECLNAAGMLPNDRKEGKKERTKNKEEIIKPEFVSAQVWDDFKTHRAKKRAPVTKTVLEEITRQAEKAGWSLEEALAETVTRGWQSFKADWVNNKKPKSNFVLGINPNIAAMKGEL